MWPSMSKFGPVSKTHKQHGNFHSRSGSPLKLTPEMTTTDAHIVSKFQLCTHSISEVIAKSVLLRFFQDHLKNTQKHINFHNRASCLLKLTPEVTTIGPHIVSKFQPSNPRISKVIAKSVLVRLFQDHLKNTKKHGNFHNRGGSLLKLIPEVTIIGAHIVSKSQLCTPSISEVIAKSVLIGFFQDPSHFKTIVHQFVSKLATWHSCQE